MGFLNWAKTIGGFAAAPFTGGATLPIAISGLGAVAGGLNNREQTSKNTNTSTSTATTTPNLDPNATTLNGQLTQNYMNLFQNQPNYADYTAGGIRDVNHLYDLQKQGLQGILASRGINGPANASAESTLEGNRYGDILNFKQKAPINFQALQLPLLQSAGVFSGSLPRGNTTTSTTTGSGTNTTPGNVAAGTLGSLASLLAYLYKQGSFGGDGGGGGGGGGGYPILNYPSPAPGSFGQ